MYKYLILLSFCVEILFAVDVKLDIPGRLQWENNNGYCAETSLQSIALYYGAWISQYAVRKAAGGPQKQQVLLPFSKSDVNVGDGKSILVATNALKFNTTMFPSKVAPQSKQALQWIKANLLQGYPVIYGVYVQDCDKCDSDYDHIVPAIGFGSRMAVSDPSFQPTDTLISYSLFDTTPIRRTFSSLPGNSLTGPNGCTFDALNGGCVPIETNYAVAITGIMDEGKTSLPIRLSVNRNDEPNISIGEKPVTLQGTVIVSKLIVGKKYRLLRYNNPVNVPVKGDAKAFLKSSYDKYVDFTAVSTSWKYIDSISSSGTVFYRCVQM